MLTRLEIRNVVLIDHLMLDVSAGLSVLTGETGAGKSILLDALGLIRGDRADTGLIRKGETQASVTAAFDVPETHAVFDVLRDQGFDIEVPLVLRRVLGADGKSRAFINDQMVSVSLMKTIGQMLIDLHGQFETGHLFDPVHHRHMVDRFGGYQNLSIQTRESWNLLAAARDELAQMRARAEQAAREEEYIRNAFDDLKKLAPEQGEEDRLLERKNFLNARVQIVETLTQALDDLQGDQGAETALARVSRHFDRLRAKLPEKVDAWLAQVDIALASLHDVTGQIDSLLFDTGEGEDSLEQVDDRLHDLRAAARRYHCRVDELPGKRDDFETQIESLVRGADLVSALQAKVQQAENAYLKAAGALSDARRKTAAKLDAAMVKELSPLKLDKARFVTDVQPVPPERYGPDGVDAVRFMVSMNAGGNLAPIDKVASGGELSRLMLALKVISRDENHVCLIFDEVDSGLGGAVADAMAQRLSRLAEGSQVLVVTHAPQVAARADHHLVVAKQAKSGKTTTSVDILRSDKERREEIARMLSGEKITDEARAAAQKLIEARAA